jgi:hypothetical protein
MLMLMLMLMRMLLLMLMLVAEIFVAVVEVVASRRNARRTCICSICN